MAVPTLSVTWEATTLAEQMTPAGKEGDRCSTKLVDGEAGETVNACGVPVGHSSLNAVPVTLTLSLKVIVTVALSATSIVPFAGTTEETVGGGSVVKLAVKLAAMFWPASTSVTCAATTVTVQVTFPGSGEVGWSRKSVVE